MKKIEAYIRPEKLEDIKLIMEKLDLNGMSFLQVMGCGSQKGWTEIIRGTEVDFNFLKKIKLELVVLDEQVEPIIDTLIKELHTGEFGDGKIFVYDVSDAIRIRTKERGDAAVK